MKVTIDWSSINNRMICFLRKPHKLITVLHIERLPVLLDYIHVYSTSIFILKYLKVLEDG